MEMTTGEIYAALRQTEVTSSAREKLNQVLVLADLVKFAKEQPLPLENEQSLNQCVEFVRETKPVKDFGTGGTAQENNVELSRPK
jgi:translation initiation factor 2B subunit (eIF-2B alpha/beta/delta family)